jgi:cytochrome P450
MTDTLLSQTTTSQAECPVQNDRRVSAPEQPATSRVEIDAQGVWHISGYDEARQILRHEFTRQAGFRADEIAKRTAVVMKKRPILYLEGEEHHRMRRETNKFFTPAITDKQYQGFMEQFADELIQRLKTQRRMNLRQLTMEMAMRVAAQVVGLTNSVVPGLRQRLEGMLNASNVPENKKSSRLYQIYSQRFLVGFLMLDVKPAIRARRKAPQNDVISYLLTRNYTDLEILTECIVYGVAGMATTREFISTALWHLMEKPHLRQRMLVGAQEERYAILHEILRLEPIVGHLFRRTTQEMTFESGGTTHTIPADTLVDINVFTTNADPLMAGDSALAICPARPLTSSLGKVGEPVISFGDGYHRCPGAYIAIQETDIFLRKILAIETLKIEKTPDVVYNKTVSGYEVNNLIISVE